MSDTGPADPAPPDRREAVFLRHATRAWQAAEAARALPEGSAERATADADFSLALDRLLRVFDHPLAAHRARPTDAAMAAVVELSEAQARTLTPPEGSETRNIANGQAIDAYVRLGQLPGIPAMLEERAAHAAGAIVPETQPAHGAWFQDAAARVLYDLGGLVPRLLLVLAGNLHTLRQGGWRRTCSQHPWGAATPPPPTCRPPYSG
jgi:hypothetical protein